MLVWMWSSRPITHWCPRCWVGNDQPVVGRGEHGPSVLTNVAQAQADEQRLCFPCPEEGMYLQRRANLTQQLAGHAKHRHSSHHSLDLLIHPPKHVGCTANG